eukprot:6188848-Prymnesium_polylepis.1
MAWDSGGGDPQLAALALPRLAVLAVLAALAALAALLCAALLVSIALGILTTPACPQEEQREGLLLQSGLQANVANLEAANAQLMDRLELSCNEKDAAAAQSARQQATAEEARQRLSDEAHALAERLAAVEAQVAEEKAALAAARQQVEALEAKAYDQESELRRRPVVCLWWTPCKHDDMCRKHGVHDCSMLQARRACRAYRAHQARKASHVPVAVRCRSIVGAETKRAAEERVASAAE